MIRITFSTGKGPSSERAIAFAHELMANKKKMIAESKKRYKTPEFQEILKNLNGSAEEI